LTSAAEISVDVEVADRDGVDPGSVDVEQ